MTLIFEQAPAPLHDEGAFLAAVDDAGTRWKDASVRCAARETAQTLSWRASIAGFERELMRAGRVRASRASGLAVSP